MSGSGSEYISADDSDQNELDRLSALAKRHYRASHLAEAAATYQQLLQLTPDAAPIHHNLAGILKNQGDIEGALRHYDRAIAIDPGFVEAHCFRSDLKSYRRGDADLAALETLAEDKRLPPDKMVYVHFALGKALEDIGEFDRAFAQLALGNALKREQAHYNEPGEENSLARIIEVFDRQLIDRLSVAADSVPRPIFILGMPRSGSTLIEQILASHPQVTGGGEFGFLGRRAGMILHPHGQRFSYPDYVPHLNVYGLRQIGQDYLKRLPKPAGEKTRITDKTPGNFWFVGLIHLMLPGARIIHTMRDPVDTCVSCFSKLFAAGQKYSYDLGELGRAYRRYYRLIAHWRSVLPPGAMLEVRYEDVVDNFEAEARRLVDYCGLPWDDRCLAFHATDRSITTASNVQVRRPLYRSSVERWRRFERHLEPLLAELAECRRSE
jgi:tetratricopeptide (TPR) repeat protein